MEYLLVFNKFKKIQSAFHYCSEIEKNGLVEEFNKTGRFKGETAATLSVFKLTEKAEAPGR